MTNRYLPLALIFSVSISTTGCITYPNLAPEKRPQHWAQLINKEQNLYQVSNWVYRSEQPLAQQEAQLSALNIDHIISLRSRNQTEVALGQEFNVIHIPIHTWAINREDVLQALKHLKEIQDKNEKVLIHCYHGSDRTGTIIAMYRIIFENWDIEDAKKEMKAGGYGYHPIWVNIDKLFKPENIKWIKQQLDPS